MEIFTMSKAAAFAPSYFTRIQFVLFVLALATLMLPATALAQLTFLPGSDSAISANENTSVTPTTPAVNTPPSASDPYSAWDDPEGIAVDGIGNIWVTDVNLDNLYKIPYSGGSYSTPVLIDGDTLCNPYGVAVDGHGNVFVANSAISGLLFNNNACTENVVEYVGGVLAGKTVIGNTRAFTSPNGIAVDSSGNVYVADYGGGLFKISGSTTTQIGSSGTTGNGSNDYAVIVDSSGNLYVSVFVSVGVQGTVYKETWNGGNSYTESVVSSAFVNPTGIALDPAGDLYVSDDNSLGAGFIYKFTPNGSGGFNSPSQLFTGLTVNGTAVERLTPEDVVLDNSGNFVILNVINANSSNYPGIYKVDVADPPTLNFGNEAFGSTTAEQTVTLDNIGHAPLTFTNSLTDLPTGYILGSGSNCPDTELLSGESCTLAIEFEPTVGGNTAENGDVVLTATQEIPVNGTGTGTADVAPAFTSASSTTFAVGTAGSFTATASGTPTPTFSEAGALPSGVTLSSAGVLSGTPAAGTGGVYSITLKASNSVSSVTQSFTLTVNQAPQITSANSATFTVGSSGSFTVTTAAGAYPTPTTVETGTLPSGVIFSGGVLSGTPAAGTGGSYPLTITAMNGTTNATQSFTLNVDQAPAITSASSTNFTVGTSGSFSVTATGFPAPTFSETGTLPSGVTISSAGTLSGTPAAGTGGSYSLTITASNGVGSNSIQNFTLYIDQPPAIISAGSATFTVGTAGSATVTTTGYPAPTIIASGGALPGGVGYGYNGNGTATISGTPIAGSGGVYSFTLTASNGVGSNATQTFTLTVDQAPAILSANSTTFIAGVPGSFTVRTSSYPIAGLSAGGSLPSGITFIDNGNNTGTLSGTAAGSENTYDLAISASNGVVPSASQSFSLTINPPPSFVVTTTSDDAGGTPANCPVGGGGTSCTLRDALAAASASGAGNISFSPAVFTSTNTAAENTITLSNGTLNIPAYTIITGLTTGSGASLANLVTVAGGGSSSNFSVFTVGSGVTGSAIANLSITSSNTTGSGGGINNNGALTVTGSTISGNAVTVGNGNAEGGGIYNQGTLTVTSSTISGNTVAASSGHQAGGGGIYNQGELTVTDSTISGNTATASGNGGGAGIVNNGATLTITDSTISANTADGTAGGLYINSGTVNLANTIISGNSEPSAPDLVNGGGTLSYNGGNQIGVSSIQLAMLGNYGGPTQTMIPLPGSAAICAASSTLLPAGVTTDQRGLPFDSACPSGYVDSGAAQGNYSLSFSNEPPSNALAGINFSAGVTLDESGSPFTAGSVTIPLVLNGNGVLTGGSASTVSGVANYPLLQVSAAGNNDTLMASLTLTASGAATPVSISTASNSFDVSLQSTTSAASSASATYSAAAQSITLSATVTSATSTVNQGTVTFTVLQGSIQIGSPVTSGTVTNGAASVNYSLPAGTTAGTYAIQAVYNPGSDFSSSSDSTQVLSIAKAAASVTLGNLIRTYSSAPLTASAVTTPANLTVIFTYTGTGGTTYGPASTAPTNAGSYSVTGTIDSADYQGSSTGTLIIGKAATGVNLTSSVNPVLAQNPTMLTATVSSSAGTPTGSVTFIDGTTPLGTSPLSGGIATLSVSTLTDGSHSLTASYSGDNDYTLSTGGSLTQLVEDFSFTISAPPVTALPGGTAVYNFTVSPVGSTTFLDNITLMISGLPTGASYNFVPSILMAGNGATPVTLTINIPQAQASMIPIAHSGAQLAANSGNHAATGLAREFAPFSLALLLLPFAGRLRRSGKRLGRTLSILLLMAAGIAATAGISACGSTGGFFAQQQKSYTITITGSSGQLSHTAHVNLTVE
jgi:CSLREA domain-containing protein